MPCRWISSSTTLLPIQPTTGTQLCKTPSAREYPLGGPSPSSLPPLPRPHTWHTLPSPSLPWGSQQPQTSPSAAGVPEQGRSTGMGDLCSQSRRMNHNHSYDESGSLQTFLSFGPSESLARRPGFAPSSSLSIFLLPACWPLMHEK